MKPTRHDFGRRPLGRTALALAFATVASPPCAHAESLLDANDDGRADVLLRHTDGTWQIVADAANQAGTALRITRDVSFLWAGGGDFNGDRRGDVMLRRFGGPWLYYPLRGSQPLGDRPGRPPMTRGAWRAVGAGDLTGDGRDDILLRNDQGLWAYYALDGSRLIDRARRPALPRSLEWRLAGMGDFDGDGRDGVLLRHETGVWKHFHINGTEAHEDTSSTPPRTLSGRWRVVGDGDFDANGRRDVLLRHANGHWRYESLTESVHPSAATTGLPADWRWRLAGIGDLNGDGMHDLLLRHIDGRWAMHASVGDRFTDGGPTALPVDPAWRVPSRPVHLPDLGLREAVAAALGLPSGHPITRRDLAGLNVLPAAGRNIVDLTGIEWATGLHTLVLDGNRIAEITPLAPLTGLRTLSLADNVVADISPLRQLGDLAELDLHGNRVQRLNPLARMAALEHLDVGFNDVGDVAALTNLRRLRFLDLSHNRIVDTDPLRRNAGLGGGDRIDLSGNPLTAASRAAVDALVRRAAEVVLADVHRPREVAFAETRRVSDYHAVSAYAADFDGDGDLDVVEADEARGTVRWYRNLGTDGFSRHDMDNSCPATHVLAADLDEDGRPDVLASCRTLDRVAWHRNLGDGFSAGHTLTDVAFHTRTPPLAVDLDGDDDLDVLWASFDREKAVAWHENLGNGEFAAYRVLTHNAAYVWGLAAADFDGDGDADVMLADQNREIGLLENLGDGLVGDRRVVATLEEYAPPPHIRSIGTADLDGDGDIDVVTDGPVWLENRAGAFRARELTGTGYADHVSTADLDRDGDVDLLYASQDHDEVAWRENVGGGNFGNRARIGAVRGALSVQPTHFDTDVYPDLLVASYYRGTLLMTTSAAADGGERNLLNPRGRPTFDASHVIDADAGRPVSIDGADLDDDGDLDLIGGSSTGRIDWYENVGGRFPRRHPVTANASELEELHAADVDADGDVDILGASFNDDTISWYENTGGGVFGVRHVITDQADGARFVHADDLDGDGDADILSASWLDDTIAWHENQGGGTFSARRIITTDADVGRAVATADLDLDGDPDALSASAHDNKVAWYENHGDGTFSEQRVIDADASYAVFVHAADLDGDGWADVVAAAERGNAITWYRNLGGTFGPARSVSVTSAGPLYLDTGDLDGDGDVDLLSASITDEVVGWHENLAEGVFADRRTLAVGDDPWSVKAADLTGDGRPDAVWAMAGRGDIAYAANLGRIPTAPQAPPPRVVARGGWNSIAVTWDPIGSAATGGSAVVGYVVVATAALGDGVLECEADADDTGCVLTGAVAGMRYNISVRAENARGGGPASTAVQVQAVCRSGASHWQASAEIARPTSAGDPAIAVVTRPQAAQGEPRNPATADWLWRTDATDAQSAARYTVEADDDRVHACPTRGWALPGVDVRTNVVAECAGSDAFDARITVRIGESTATVPWRVRCLDGNARIAGVEFLQGPMVWRSTHAEELGTFASPLAGRGAALVAIVEHDAAFAPDVAASVGTDGTDGVLSLLAEPLTVAPSETPSNLWETAYVFGLPGARHRSESETQLAVDPEGVLSETDTDDNGAKVSFRSESLPKFRMRFVPIESRHGEPTFDPQSLMSSIHDFFPIGDDYEAFAMDTHVFTGEHWDQGRALDELLHRWNVEADGDEYWQGIYAYPYDGSSCGYAYYDTRVSVAAGPDGGCTPNIYAHELGHNLSLPHAPGGCGAGNPDPDYPYPAAGIGPRRGWLFSGARFIEPEDGFADTMSYCSPSFISDYNYNKALAFRERQAGTRTAADALAQSEPSACGGAGDCATALRSGVTASATSSNDAAQPSPQAPMSLAVTGRIDQWGEWSVVGVATSGNAARPQTQATKHRIELRDASDDTVLYAEPLAILPSAHGRGAAWHARMPIPSSAPGATLVGVVVTGDGTEVFRFDIDPSTGHDRRPL